MNKKKINNDVNIKTNIYYFSSTGNSLTVAKKVSEILGNSQILNIPKIINTEIEFSADRIIIIFPVYIWGLPNIIRCFIEKINLPKQIPLYAVATNAGFTGDPHKMVNKILEKNNLKLTSGFLVWMPENFTPKYGTWPKKLENLVLHLSNRKLRRIINYIQMNRKGIQDKSFRGLNGFLTAIHYKIMQQLFIEKSLKPQNYFLVSNDCNKCGICAKICPVKNILIEDKPIWNDHCELCMGCFQWCPQKAIQFSYFGKSINSRYHHPDVTINDFI